MQPTRARQWVIVFAITLAVLSYIDRVIIAQAAGAIQADLGLSTMQWGWVLGVFSAAYALFEIPGGWMGDRWGAKKVLLRVVTLWSFFTAATGWAWNYASLLVCRLLFGVGEAGCFPNLTKSFTMWLPQHERVRAQGWMWLAARWGGAITPLMVAWLILHMHWRVVFGIFGAVGIVWAVLFHWWYRDRPRDHPSVNEAELAFLPAAPPADSHHNVPWRKIITSRSVWLLWLQYFFISVPWWFFIQWLAKYVQEARGFNVKEAGGLLGAFLTGLPLLLGGMACWLAGQLAPQLARRLGGVGRARRWLGFGALVCAGLMFPLTAELDNPILAMLAMGFAGFFNDLSIPGSWGACMDIGGRYAGSVSGGMNTFGAGGGAVAAPLVAILLTYCSHAAPESWAACADLGGRCAGCVSGSLNVVGLGSAAAPAPLLAYLPTLFAKNWPLTLYILGGFYAGAAACWLGIDPVTPLERPDADSSEPPSNRTE